MRGLRAIGCGCLIILSLWLFHDVLWGGQRLAFRDVAHFYGPLTRLVHSEWAADRVPLWDPYSGIGVPLAASPTAAAFYPVQLIGVLPLAPGHILLTYVMLHLLLAFASCYALAREIGSGITAALLAAVAYAFSGSVLFQYCNVVFLVGAAWLPAAWWAARRLMHRRQLRYAAVLGTVLALMTLGGDPQMAYHTGLIVAAYAVYHGFIQTENVKPGLIRSRALLLIASLAMAVVLSAVQWIPAVELTRRSSRGTPEFPRNLYQLMGSRFALASNSVPDKAPRESANKYAALLGRTTAGDDHQRQTYRFSVAPWHLAEFLLPNFSGSLFPTNQRWIRAIPAEGRTWVASLYMGLFPALLAWSCFGTGADRQTRCLRWFTLFCLLAASGHYALGWIAREVANLLSIDPNRVVVGDAFGGVYWMLVNFLPGYETFRYPGKWLVPMSLGIALLAAKGWDRQDIAYWKRVARGARLLLLTSFSLFLVAGCTYAICPNCLPTFPADQVFGPPDIDGTWRGILLSLLHAGIAAGCVIWITATIIGAQQATNDESVPGANTPASESATNSSAPRASRLCTIVLLLTAVDLMVAQQSLIGTAPETSWQSTSLFRTELLLMSDLNRQPAEIPMRVLRARNKRPDVWSKEVDPNRLAEVVRSDRGGLSPLYHLDARINVLRVPGTMQLADFRVFLASIDSAPDAQRSIEQVTELNTLAVDCDQRLYRRGLVFEWIEPTALTDIPRQDQPIDGGSSAARPQRHPRAWITHQWETRPEQNIRSYGELKQLTRSVLYENGTPRDLRAHPVVETSNPLRSPPPALASLQLETESCRITHYDPQRVEVEVELLAEGLVVLADQFYPGWEATVDTTGIEQQQPTDIHRVNRVLRGVWLPQGEHRIRFTYRPRGYIIGAVVSSLGWLSLLVVAGITFVRRAR